MEISQDNPYYGCLIKTKASKGRGVEGQTAQDLGCSVRPWELVKTG